MNAEAKHIAPQAPTVEVTIQLTAAEVAHLSSTGDNLRNPRIATRIIVADTIVAAVNRLAPKSNTHER